MEPTMNLQDLLAGPTPLMSDLAKIWVFLHESGRGNARVAAVIFARPPVDGQIQFESVWNDEVVTLERRAEILQVLLEANLQAGAPPGGH